MGIAPTPSGESRSKIVPAYSGNLSMLNPVYRNRSAARERTISEGPGFLEPVGRSVPCNPGGFMSRTVPPTHTTGHTTHTSQMVWHVLHAASFQRGLNGCAHLEVPRMCHSHQQTWQYLESLPRTPSKIQRRSCDRNKSAKQTTTGQASHSPDTPNFRHVVFNRMHAERPAMTCVAMIAEASGRC
jgi:hypothetical protein